MTDDNVTHLDKDQQLLVDAAEEILADCRTGLATGVFGVVIHGGTANLYCTWNERQVVSEDLSMAAGFLDVVKDTLVTILADRIGMRANDDGPDEAA